MTGLKRSLEESSSHDGDAGSPREAHVKPSPSSPTTASGSSSASSFRNVSACNRCRLRKNRCDQRLPSCASCDKAGVKCVGYDPITKREIPRSYVFYLETRVSYLESLLHEKNIPFAAAEEFTPSYPSANGAATVKSTAPPAALPQHRNGAGKPPGGLSKEENDKYDREKLSKLVSNVGMVSVQGASDPRFLGSTSGISFARVVFAAVKSSVSGSSSERGSVRGAKSLTTNVADGGTSMRDSFFGLHTKPAIRQAPFPDRELGSRLVELYFEHANPQIPILHRGEFMEMFERVYTSNERHRTSRESYMLNIVFAIGAGIIMGSSDSGDSPASDSARSPIKSKPSPPSSKKRRLAGQQHQPEEYHASAIVHLENFLGSSPAADRPDGFGAGLEELQAVLLLAGFALLRPVAPGLWYIVGVAVRLGVDLGLHYEDGVGIDGSASEDQNAGNMETTGNGNGTIDAKERGRRQWVRDLRRRLWWCVYSLDRLVSTCVGRPFGITDQVVTTEFPSLLDDRFITKEGFIEPREYEERVSYKVVAHHYFRLRLLQSEVLQVLQHRQAQQARASGANQGNDYMHTKLPSPFLVNFDSFRSWRVDIDRRLLEWKDSAPTQLDAGVQFSPLFLELNYWQAIIMLYRQSLVVPSGLASELGNTDGSVSSPSLVGLDERDDEELVFLKVAAAGQKVLKLYRQLHRVHLVNYTFLATHHLFMAGISFLYAVWHSPVVRSHLSLDDVDFTVLAATSVLGDLIEKCPPAEACRDAFDRMSKATIQMCMSTTGFGPQALRGLSQSLPTAIPTQTSHSPATTYTSASDPDARSDTEMTTGFPANNYFSQPRRPVPRFDMNLRDLFSEDETDKRSFSRISNQINRMGPPPQPIKQEPQQMPFNTDTLKISPQLRSLPQQFAIDPNLRPNQTLPSPQQMQPQQLPFTTAPTLSPPLSQSPYQVSNTLPYNTFAQNINNTYPDLGFSDLDFLDSFPVQGAQGLNANAEAAGGLQDLGFGMGFGDGTHDWSDGNGFDLFDGFFFGPGGNGAAM
ncbi:fungal-specific transcription factor domain-containing protein [Lophiotrema nucula]|uniref:Fungal-specific transcription factor domain-containing protein n=1 Tax=Lophiotrema nucula TaxID=690887 RepID=A0A6A5YU77_9PLEO|nr:fungal-specific transcription factor domain-containing protein [Lophiotrema nucula]